MCSKRQDLPCDKWWQLGWGKGYIDEEKINRLVPDFLERDVYVCGPPVMMKKVISDLVRLGIKKNKIYFEKFSLGS